MNKKLAASIASVVALIAGFVGGVALVDEPEEQPEEQPSQVQVQEAKVVNGVQLESEYTYKILTVAEGPVWLPLECTGAEDGTGAEVLNGVAEVRLRAWATNLRSGTARPPFRSNFQTPTTSKSKFWAERWYSTRTHVLPSGERVEVADVVHDLESHRSPDSRFPGLFRLNTKAGTSNFAGLGTDCIFEARSVPDVNRFPTTSHRTMPTNMVDRLRLTLEKYGDKTPLPCGGPTGGRVRIRGFAMDAEGGRFDFHWHQEAPASIGPDQDGDPRDKRFGEEGTDSIFLQPGVEREVLTVVSGVGANGGGAAHQAFHFAQQGPAPMNQVFCRLDGPERK